MTNMNRICNFAFSLCLKTKIFLGDGLRPVPAGLRDLEHQQAGPEEAAASGQAGQGLLRPAGGPTLRGHADRTLQLCQELQDL